MCGSQAVRGTEGGDPAADSGPNLLILSSGGQGTEGGDLVSHSRNGLSRSVPAVRGTEGGDPSAGDAVILGAVIHKGAVERRP